MPDFRITSDGNEQDIQEIYEMLKIFNLSNLEDYPYTGKRHYYTKELNQ